MFGPVVAQRVSCGRVSWRWWTYAGVVALQPLRTLGQLGVVIQNDGLFFSLRRRALRHHLYKSELMGFV